MNVRSLEKMEEIVASHKFLSWNGWDVVSLKYNPMGWSKNNGRFVKGKWFTEQRYLLTETGWEIPSNLVR